MRSHRRRRVLRREAKRVFVWVFVAAFLATAAVVIWLGTPYHGEGDPVGAVATDDDVLVGSTAGGYVLRPPGNPTDVGLIFYPGARVHPDAYLASLAPLVANAHITVVVPKMRLNMALLSHRAARGVRAAHPQIDRWYVGGHSLGGVAACRYANHAGEHLIGLVLYASYCDVDVHDADLRVLSIRGEADGVLDRDAARAAASRLPPDRTTVSLPGVNHTQFGDYRGQAGDEPSGTSDETAHNRLANATVAWLRGGESTKG